MAQISSSFVLRSKYPNFERDSFATFADMESVPSSWMDEGHISYCVAEKSHYIFNSANGTLTGKARWTKIPFTVDVSERKVYQVTSNADLTQYASKGTGTLVYVNNEKEYYVYNGSAFVKLIDINVDSKLSNYYKKSEIGTWSSGNLISYLDNKYAAKSNTISSDVLKSYATESYVENSIGSALYNYVSDEALNNELSTIRVEISNVNSNLNTKLTNQVSNINSKFDNYVTENELKTSLDNYYTQLEIGSVLEKYVTLGTFNLEIGSIYDNLNNVINSTNNKFNNYATKTNLNDALKNYISKDALNITLGSYVTDAALESTLSGYITIGSLEYSIGSVQNALNDKIASTNSKFNDYVTKTNLTNSLKDYTTNSNLTNKLSNYVTDTKLGTVLKDYVTENKLGTALEGYVTIGSFGVILGSYVTFDNLDQHLDSLSSSMNSNINAVNNKFNNYTTKTNLNDALKSYISKDALNITLGSYVTGTALEATLGSYVTIGSLEYSIGSVRDYLNIRIDSTNSKFNDYVTKTNLNNTLKNYTTSIDVNNTLKNYITENTLGSALTDYVTIGSFQYTLGSYITREEFEATNNSISPDTIKDINNKISTVSAATGAVKQSLDNYKIEVENKYVKTTVLESDYVKGSTFQNNAAITTNRLNELEDLIHSSGGVLLKSEFETFKEFAENTYAKPEDISSKLNNYAPAEENRNKWISSDLAGDLSGLTGQEVAARAYSYNAVLDQILFGKFTPEITDPYVDVQLKDDWDGKGYINWYDEEKRIIVVKSGSTGPDGGDFLPINAKDAIISYPKGIDLSTNFTNGILPSTNLKQNSVGFCKIQDENGEWTYYRKDNNIYHVPTTLEVGEYRYYMAAYFQKGSPALNNEGFIVDEWNENTAVESENYITLIASKPTFYNTKSGLIENPLVFWNDNMVDYMTLPPTCHAEQIFMLPKKVKELYIWNDIKGDYALVPMEYQRVEGVITNNLIPSYFDEIIGDDGYYMYKYDIDKHGHRGEIKIKVVF